MEALDLIGLAVIESWPSFTSGAEHSKVAVSCLSDEAVDFIKTLFDGEHNEQTTVNIETELEETEIPLCSSPISFISFLYLDENSKANTDETPELGIYFPSECNFAERQQMAELSEPVLQVPSESLVCLTDGDEAENRRPAHSYSFHCQSPTSAQSDAEPCESSASAKASIGLISDILDGVVFAPVGTAETPQLSPHTRSRSTLLSFRPAAAASAEPEEPNAEPSAKINLEAIPDSVKPLRTSSTDLVRINSIKAPLTHLPPNLETLFQQELAAKVKKRSLVVQQQQQQQQVKSVSKPKEEPPRAPERKVASPVEPPEFANPLYQVLHDCLSGTIPPAPPLPPDWYDRVDDEATYADIDETDASHYKTVKSTALRTAPAKEEAIYAQVGDRTKANKSSGKVTVEKEAEAIYENVEDLHEVEQTYANILPVVDSNSNSKVLTALVLDVATAASRAVDLSSRSSGHSSDSPPTSSPEQLSPTDSLANVSVGSVRSIGTPDSGVFGLLRPASEEAVRSADEKEDSQKPSQDKIELLSNTLQQFEKLEKLSSEFTVPKQTVKIEKSVSFALEMSTDIEMETVDILSLSKKVEVKEIDLEKEDDYQEFSTELNHIGTVVKEEPKPAHSKSESCGDNKLNELFEAKLATCDADEKSEQKGDRHSEEQRPASRVVSPEPDNLGARIFEDVSRKRERLERERNQKLGLVEAGESLERLNLKRYDVIEQMTPKKPKKVDWLPSSIAENEASEKSQPEKEQLSSKTGIANKKTPSDNKEASNTTDENSMQLEEAPFAEQKAGQTQIRTLSPPPGFDGETMHFPAEESQASEPFLGNDDFVDVGSITFKEDDDEESKLYAQFDREEDNESFAGGQSSADSVQFERNPVKGSRPIPALYFEPDQSSRDESDDDLEAASSVSSFSMKEPVHNHHNPTETLIEREIRLQREREEAVLRERQRAMELIAVKKHSKTTETVSIAQPEETEKRRVMPVDNESVTSTRKPVEPKRLVESAPVVSAAEIRISEEIRELKRREEELRLLREAQAQMRDQQHSAVDHSSLIANAVNEDEGLYSDAERDVCSEANSSRVESPEAGILSSSEYSKFPHQRTQSMDSMSSGHSSGDHGPTVYGQASIHPSEQLKRGRPSKSVVMPLENPSDEEVPVYRRMSKETPIEREIRLAREREEALRREKGFQPASSAAAPTRKTSNENRAAYRSGNGIPENRNTQHRYASSVIQREIEEIAEREKELLRDGKIQTTSVDRVDSKVPVIGDFAKVSDSKRMLAKSSSVPPKSYETSSRSNDEDERPVNKPATLPAKGISVPRAAPVPALTNPTGRRNFSHIPGPQRGIMEKFILSRGRLSQPAAFNMSPAINGVSLIPPSSGTITPGSTAGDPAGVIHSTTKSSQASVRHVPTVVRPIEIQSFKHEEEGSHAQENVTPVRRHYATTEEKIQQEFREMQQREEELRLTRSKLLAKSQPNLLDLIDDHSGVDTSSRGMRAALSVSDLLADEQPNGEAKLQEKKAYNAPTAAKGARRKSALIAQWESRIHQQDF